MKSKIILAISAFFLVFASMFSVNAAFAKGKNTIMYVYMDPCKMCHEFERRVLSDPEVKQELAARFNFKKVNANQTRVEGVRLTPTVQIYDEKNKKIYQWLPSLDKEDFLEVIKKY